MRTETSIVFIAFDGERFHNENECRVYERDNAHRRLSNLSENDVQSAIKRLDPDLADAFEYVGGLITRARLDAGERKRERRGAAREGVATAVPDAAAPSNENDDAAPDGEPDDSQPPTTGLADAAHQNNEDHGGAQ